MTMDDEHMTLNGHGAGTLPAGEQAQAAQAAPASTDGVSRHPAQAAVEGGHEHEHEHGHEAGEHEHHTGFVHAFRERAISLRSMERPLRLITGLAIAQLIVAAILIATRSLPMPGIVVTAQNNQLIQMPLPIFVVSVVFLVLAWSYMLAGMLHAHPVARLVGLVIFTAVMAPVPDAINPRIFGFPLRTFLFTFDYLTHLGVWWAPLVVDGSLAALWVLGLATWLLDRRVAASERAGKWHHRSRIQVHTFGIVLILVGILYLGAWVGARTSGVPRLFPEGVSIQLLNLSFFMVPVLFLAGTDFAEWGQVTGERVAEVLGRVRTPTRPRPPLALAALTGVVAVAILGNSIRLLWGAIWVQLAMGALVGLILLLLWVLARGADARRGGGEQVSVRPRPRALPLRMPVKALAALAVVYVGLMSLGSAIQVTPGYTASTHQKFQLGGVPVPYRHTRQPHFTIDYPSLWEVKTVEDRWPSTPVIIGFSGAGAAEPASFWIVEAGSHAEQNLARFRQDWFAAFFKGYRVSATPAPAHGPWQVTNITLTDTRGGRVPPPSGKQAFRGTVWERSEGSYFVLLNGFTTPTFFALHVPIFSKMVDSWQPALADTRVPAPSAEGDSSAEDAGQIDIFALLSRFWFAATLVAAVFLVVRMRRGKGGALEAGALLVVLVGLIFLLQNLPQELAGFGLPQEKVPSFRLSGVQASVAVATLLSLAWLALSRRPRVPVSLTRDAGTRAHRGGVDAREGRAPGSRAVPDTRVLAALLTLNVALQILVWMFNLYSGAMDIGGRFTVVQAVVIVLALLWDIVMSGEAITNVRGSLFPRHTRVLLFFGYIMLVAAAVLYFSSMQVQATSAGVEPQFESEEWPQLGLGALGLPLLLALCALQLARLFNRTNAEAAAEPHSHGGAVTTTGGHPRATVPVADVAGIEPR